MNVHCIQHVEFESPAYLETIMKKHNHHLTTTHLFRNEDFPDCKTFDLLLIMGGPMGVYDDSAYSWLPNEKKFIRQCVDQKKKAMGICLGAQLLAHVLDAEVQKNRVKEIGFYPVRMNNYAGQSVLLKGLPPTYSPFHWHGDTFDIPHGAQLFASSDACRNQGFVLYESIIGLQFHLEATAESLDGMIKHCGDELVNEDWIQDIKEIRSLYAQTERENHELMEKMYLNLCNA